MTTFLGITAVLFFLFFLGASAPFKLIFKTEIGYLEESFLSNIGVSIYISWVLVFVYFFLNLMTPILLYFICAYSFLNYILKNKKNHEKVNLFFFISLTLYFIFYLAFSIPNYSLSFTSGDAVVSWNRWAIELYSNHYNPVNAGYPILFPGIWALIYKFQNNQEIWFFSKSTLLIFPLMIALTSSIYMRKNSFSGYFFSFLVIYIFFYTKVYSQEFNITSGYMDYPVSIMILTGLSFVSFAILSSGEREKVKGYIVLSSIFIGLASITKQPGMVVITFYLIFLTYFVLTKFISLKAFIYNVIVTLLPLTIFLLIFNESKASFIGNMHELNALSNSAGAGNVLRNAYNIVFFQSNFLMPYLLWTSVFLSLLNVFYLNNILGKYGFSLFFVFVFGFFSYAECCSYDQRNSLWLYSIIILSSTCFVLNFSEAKIKNHIRDLKSIKFTKKRKMKVFLASLLFLFAICNLFNSRIINLSKESKEWLIPNKRFFVETSSHLGKNGVILSNIQTIGFDLKYKDRVGISWDGYSSFIGKGMDGFFDLCSTSPTYSSKEMAKSRTLKEISSCRPGSVFYMYKSDFQVVRSAHPDVNFQVFLNQEKTMLISSFKFN